MKYTTLIIVITTVIFSSCVITDGQKVKGDGNITSKTYDLKNFSIVEANNDVAVYLTKGSTYQVMAETDDNLFQYLDISVQDGKTLEIKYKNNTNVRPSNETKIYITAPWLDELYISESSSLSTQGKFDQDKKLIIKIAEASSGKISVRAPILDLTASEASSLTIDGESRDVKVRASEASTVNAFDLKAENVDANASEASTAHVFGSVSLKLNASEASTLKYKGATNTTINSREASSISRAD